MNFNLRSFSEILAQKQGEIRLKPGRSYVKNLTEAQVKEIFGGEIPSALAIGNIIVNVRKIEHEIYRIIIRRAT
jgi:hypothetical protein